MLGLSRLNRRRARRCNIMGPATIDSGDRAKACTITDLSERGARLELPGAMPVRVRVKLICERFGELHGVIVWCRGTTAGIRFNLPASDVLRLLAPVVPGMGRRQPVKPEPNDGGEQVSFGRKSRAA